MVRRGLNPASASPNGFGATLPGGLFLAQVFLGILCFCGLGAHGAPPPINAEQAAQYFTEARELGERDRGRLWGHSLLGPILLVDPITRQVAANLPDREQRLTKTGEVYVGRLPANVPMANTAIEWAGVRWTMLMLPLPENRFRRRILLAHELWHRIQEEIGFPSSGVANHHLETRDGRIWLQLEWRALAAALIETGRKRKAAVSDALVFRAYRRSLFQNAAEEERAMEMHEGLAEYTGIALGGVPNVLRWVADHNLKEAVAKPTFMRSFAYASGPAYGVLLDRARKDWRKALKPTDELDALLRVSSRLRLPADLAETARSRARNYGGPELFIAEMKREEERQKLLAASRQKFIDGPVLVIPLQQMKMEFDPGELIALEPRGTVYPKIKIVDLWGTLTVSGGALLESDFSKVTVSAPVNPRAKPIAGDGWMLELSGDWELKAGLRAGDQIIAKQSQ